MGREKETKIPQMTENCFVAKHVGHCSVYISTWNNAMTLFLNSGGTMTLSISRDSKEKRTT